MDLNVGFEIKQQHQETKLLGHNNSDQWFVLEVQMQKL